MRVAGGTDAKRTDHAEIRDLASKCEDNAVHSYIRDAIIVRWGEAYVANPDVDWFPSDLVPTRFLRGFVWGSLSESGASSLLDYLSTISSKSTRRLYSARAFHT